LVDLGLAGLGWRIQGWRPLKNVFVRDEI